MAETVAFELVRIPDDPVSEQICRHDNVSPNVTVRIGSPARGVVTADTVDRTDVAVVTSTRWAEHRRATADVAADTPGRTGENMRLRVEIERSKG